MTETSPARTNGARDSELGLAELVRSYLQRRVPVPPLDWLPLAEVVLDDPHRWAQAFADLRVEQQYDLTDRLRMDGAGPWAETLLVALSAHAHQISDEQVRADVLADAQVAAERRAARAGALRQRAEALAAAVGCGADRLREGFDIAAELATLEARLARLRGEAHERDGEFAKMFEVEHEILREETRMGVLARYDEAARRGALAELRAEVEALRGRKRALEEEVVAATAERDRLRRETGELQAAAHTVSAELDTLRATAALHQSAVPRLRSEAEALRARAAELDAEQRATAAEVAAVGERTREAAERLRGERALLEELAAAARCAAGMEEIERKIQEVLTMLPDDAADQAV
jgi:chromosome segregation ATPase